MFPIDEALRETFFPALFGGEEVDADCRKIICHSVNPGGLGIPDPRLSEDSTYNTSKVARRELISSLLGGSYLNYLGHRYCVFRSSVGTRKEQKYLEMADLTN